MRDKFQLGLDGSIEIRVSLQSVSPTWFNPSFSVATVASCNVWKNVSDAPDNLMSLKLWRLVNRRAQRTSWCRCLLGDTLKTQKINTSLKKSSFSLLCQVDGFRACVPAYMWCLSPSTRRIHTDKFAAADWDGISRRPSRFSDEPELCQRPPQSALLVWRSKRNTILQYCTQIINRVWISQNRVGVTEEHSWNGCSLHELRQQASLCYNSLSGCLHYPQTN